MLNFSRPSCLLAVLMMLSSAPAMALKLPDKSPADPRIQTVNYAEGDVIRINAVTGFITTVVFAPGEKVVNYGSGFSTAWEFAADGNQFFLKPKGRNGTTNLVVVTDKRIYNFDVVLVGNSNKATYKLTFAYPTVEAAMLAAQKQQQHLESLIKKPDPALSTAPPQANFNYSMNFGKSAGSRNLAPASVFDDGLFTWFRFSPGTDFPAVYRVTSDGEAIVTSHVEGGMLAVHGVFPELRLRAGSDVVGIYNDSFDPRGKAGSRQARAAAAGTPVSGVTRVIKE